MLYNGYATKAMKLILDEAINKHRLNIIESGTSPDNICSQIVLIKNGFEFSGRTTNHIYLNGKWCDSINFEKVFN
ncbi:GNAT family protein [Clostridium sp.]|uniref:GNAT family N-acetyltransferase n=1 Tax=Clostridium sp. TaxID=1506 RepID=UPI0034555470